MGLCLALAIGLWLRHERRPAGRRKGRTRSGFRPRGRRVHLGGQGSPRRPQRARGPAARAAAGLPAALLCGPSPRRGGPYRRGCCRVSARLGAQSDRFAGRRPRSAKRGSASATRSRCRAVERPSCRRSWIALAISRRPDSICQKTPRCRTRCVFSAASSRAVFTALARFSGLNLVFDTAFREAPITVDLRKATLANALASVTAATRTFYRVTAQRTITIIPDTPAKRREYEESVVRTFYLSNADVKEVIDLLRIVVDVRQISPITATNAISLKDTPERIAAAARLIAAIDKARPGSHHRRGAARGRSHAPAGVRAAARVARAPTASPGSGATSTDTGLTLAGSAHSDRVGRRACRRPWHLLPPAEERREHPDAREPAAAHVRRHRRAGAGSASGSRCR